MEGPSRIELARRRLTLARRAIGVAAVAGFVAFAFAARASHPGSNASSSTSSSASTSATTQAATQSDDDSYGFDFGQSSIAPSTGTPSIQSGGS